MTVSDGGARIGAASFGIGLDLAQLERDLDRAEQLVKSRAQRIQGSISAIPVGGSSAPGGFSPSRAVAAAGAATRANGGAPVAPWVQTLYDAQVAAGKSDEDARASIRRATGLLPSEMSGLRTAGSGGAASFSAPNGVAASAARPPAARQLAARVGGGSAAGGANPLSALGLGGSQGIARTVGAVIGLGAGLNFAVTAAATLHRAIQDAAESSVQLAQNARQVGVAFGASGSAFTGAGVSSFLANPRTAGTAGEYLGLISSLAPLGQQLGLTTQQIRQVADQSGVLARLWGTDLATAGKVLQDVLRGNLQAGQALNLNLSDQYGALKGVGLTYNELAAAVGPAAATQKVLAAAQTEVDRQLRNNAQNADDTTQAFDRLGKTVDRLRSGLADLAKAPVTVAANVATAALGGGLPPDTHLAQTPDEVRARIVLGAAGERQQARDLAEAQRTARLRAAIPASIGGTDAQAGVDALDQQQSITNQSAINVNARTAAARLQASQAGIRATIAQSQLDILGGQSDLRRLSVQGQINELAQTRLDIEGRLAPVLLEQQRVQDAITLTTRENLTLTEATLRAQQAAYPSANAAFALSYQQQRIRLQAQVQQSRAIRGLAPAAGIPGIPELFGQARDLALIAPEVNLAALQSQYPADVAARAQAQAATSRQLAAIPAQQRLQQLQDVLIPLGQARSAAQAAADAIERSLQGADLLSGPDRIKAQQDLANARIQEADAAGKIAQAQVDAGSGINATANVNIIGLTDVQAATQAVLEAFRPQIINAINAAVNNPRPPAGPPTDRGNP